jgi:site-specific recombinase XerD
MKLHEAIGEFTRWKYIKVKPTTIYGYDGNLRHFCIFLRDPDIEDITLNDILDWIEWNTKMGFKTSQVEKHCVAIKELLKFYSRQNYRVVDPELVPYPRKSTPIPRVANDDDYYKLLNAIPKLFAYYHIRNRAIIALLHDTGARIGEIMSLDVGDVDLKGNSAVIRTEKSREDAPFRNIFWRKETTIYLQTWVVKRKKLLKQTELTDKDAFFISVNGGVCGDGRTGRRMDILACSEMLRKYSNLAGLKYNLNAHSFRHNLGRKLAERGADNSNISQILGHKSLDSSRIYTQLFNPQLKRLYHKILGK